MFGLNKLQDWESKLIWWWWTRNKEHSKVRWFYHLVLMDLTVEIPETLTFAWCHSWSDHPLGVPHSSSQTLCNMPCAEALDTCLALSRSVHETLPLPGRPLPSPPPLFILLFWITMLSSACFPYGQSSSHPFWELPELRSSFSQCIFHKCSHLSTSVAWVLPEGAEFSYSSVGDQ